MILEKASMRDREGADGSPERSPMQQGPAAFSMRCVGRWVGAIVAHVERALESGQLGAGGRVGGLGRPWEGRKQVVFAALSGPREWVRNLFFPAKSPRAAPRRMPFLYAGRFLGHTHFF
jgi:hypothetical protein